MSDIETKASADTKEETSSAALTPATTEEKRKKIDELMNRKRKATSNDEPGSSEKSVKVETETEEEGEKGDEELRRKAKEKILWEAKRGKERADRVGAQGCKMMTAPHGLTKDEVGRYSRQILIPEFGIRGQERLRASRVLIVGAGGLGCPCATYLAAGGVGTIGIVDFDHVSLDNLHRQVAHKQRNIGKKKTESLKESLLELNSLVKIICHSDVLDRHNALVIFGDYDVIVDCSDNPATRYLINDACVLLKKPLVSGSALRWEGQLTVYNYGEKCPCYRCIFPAPPAPNLITNCAEGGVLGPVVGMLGSLQALEVIKIASGAGSPYAGRLLLFDGESGRITSVTLRERSPNCAVCGKYPIVTELIDYTAFCGSGVKDKIPDEHILSPAERIGVAEYAIVRKAKGAFQDEMEENRVRLVDTRPPNEFAIGRLPEATNIPLEKLQKMEKDSLSALLRLADARDDRDVFVICHRGNDSQKAVRLLQEKLSSAGLRIRDIEGGYQKWAEIVDPQFPEY